MASIPATWGRHIGFYGGINYGFGYVGLGYEGGYWNSGRFFYNRVYNHIDERHVHNVYNYNAGYRARGVPRASFNGGQRGVQAPPGHLKWPRGASQLLRACTLRSSTRAATPPPAVSLPPRITEGLYTSRQPAAEADRNLKPASHGGHPRRFAAMAVPLANVPIGPCPRASGGNTPQARRPPGSAVFLGIFTCRER